MQFSGSALLALTAIDCSAPTSMQYVPMRRLQSILDQPFVGFAPWILLSIIEGPNRLVLAAALACGLAVATCIAGTFVKQRPKILDVTAIVFFGALTIVATVVDSNSSRWLGVWSSELSNIAIALIVGLSIVFHRPFTLPYARETTDPEHWETPLFLRINYVITGVWAVVFVVIAIVGYIGDGPLHQPDNIWTSWIVQIGLVILAIKFTSWYPDYATVETEDQQKVDGSRLRHPVQLFRPLAAYLVPVGIAVLIIADSQWWVGALLIALGVVASKKLREAANQPTAHETIPPEGPVSG